MNSDKHLIATLLEPLEQGATFTDWPLHLTIVPWFGVDIEKERELDNLLDNIALRQKSTMVRVGATAMFGVGEDIPVNVIEPDDSLSELHLDVYESIRAAGFEIIGQNYFGKNYNPHVSEQNGKKVIAGEVLEIRKFTLIKRVGCDNTGKAINGLVKKYWLK